MLAGQAEANIQKYDATRADPDYKEYQRWFGRGRDMTETEWQKYQTLPRYTQGTPQQWDQWDRAVQIYKYLPRYHPDKFRLAPQVKVILRLSDPSWKRILAADELSQMDQSGELAALDAAFAARQGGRP